MGVDRMELTEANLDHVLSRAGRRCECTAGRHGHRGRCEKQLARTDYGVTWRALRIAPTGWADAPHIDDFFAMCNDCAEKWERLAWLAVGEGTGPRMQWTFRHSHEGKPASALLG